MLARMETKQGDEQMSVECMECKREREPMDDDYNPMQVIFGAKIGWYSDDDGELCGECMSALLKGQDR